MGIEKTRSEHENLLALNQEETRERVKEAKETLEQHKRAHQYMQQLDKTIVTDANDDMTRLAEQVERGAQQDLAGDHQQVDARLAIQDEDRRVSEQQRDLCARNRDTLLQAASGIDRSNLSRSLREFTSGAEREERYFDTEERDITAKVAESNREKDIQHQESARMADDFPKF